MSMLCKLDKCIYVCVFVRLLENATHMQHCGIEIGAKNKYIINGMQRARLYAEHPITANAAHNRLACNT